MDGAGESTFIARLLPRPTLLLKLLLLRLLARDLSEAVMLASGTKPPESTIPTDDCPPSRRMVVLMAESEEDVPLL